MGISENRPNINLGEYYHEYSKDLRMGGFVNIPKNSRLANELEDSCF